MAEKKATAPKFRGVDIKQSKRLAEYRDILAVLLKDDAEYTIAEVEAAIEKFKKTKA